MIDDQNDSASKFYIHEATLWFEKYIPNSFTISFYEFITAKDLVIGRPMQEHSIEKCFILKEDLKSVGVADEHYVKFSKLIQLEDQHVQIIYPHFVDNNYTIVHSSIRPAFKQEIEQYRNI